MSEDDRIDELLALYLQLLDIYTDLRTELSELQSSVSGVQQLIQAQSNVPQVYHSLARANFSAERGIQYGQDFYDERMQATKLLATEQSKDGLPKLELVDLDAKPASEIEDKEPKANETKLEQTTLTLESKRDHAEMPEGDHGPKKGSESEAPRLPKSKDPLRWFGILSPPSLRQAQSSATKLVGTAVKLSSVVAEMKGVEIEIRRARKRKVKEEGRNGKVMDKDAAGGIVENGVKQEIDATPPKVNKGGGCGRVAVSTEVSDCNT